MAKIGDRCPSKAEEEGIATEKYRHLCAHSCLLNRPISLYHGGMQAAVRNDGTRRDITSPHQWQRPRAPRVVFQISEASICMVSALKSRKCRACDEGKSIVFAAAPVVFCYYCWWRAQGEIIINNIMARCAIRLWAPRVKGVNVLHTFLSSCWQWRHHQTRRRRGRHRQAKW